MYQPGFEQRYSQMDTDLSRDYGDTPVRTLRKIYGLGFAKGFPETARLGYVLRVQPTQASLMPLRHDYAIGVLPGRIARG